MKKITPILILVLALVIVFVAYLAGLNSTFLLDDYPNLQNLELLNNLVTSGNTSSYSTAFWEFVLTGEAGALGRPISLLSFALQAESWPTDPYAFKFVNVLIHLLNGVLVFVLALLLSRHTSIKSEWRQYFAITVCLFWLIAPIQLSSVTYVIQRMTSLSATFALVGLLTYYQGRAYVLKERLNIAWVWLFVFTPFAMLLSMLCKENGILLSVYILVLEATLLSGSSIKHPTYKLWRLGVALPLVALVLYFVSDLEGRLLNVYELRDFSLYERVLTESRILFDYLRMILVPNGADLSLFHDDYVVSKSLFQPWTTILSVLSLLAIFTYALIKRRSDTIIAFSVLWYLGGHVLESSVVGLELYFEHRNYLPSFGIWFAVVLLGFSLLRYMESVLTKCLFGALGLAYFGLQFHITYAQNVLWSDPVKHSFYLAENSPESQRARAFLSSVYEGAGYTREAAAVARSMNQKWPDLTGSYFHLLYLHCVDSSVSAPDIEDMKDTVRSTGFDIATIGYLRKLVAILTTEGCKESTPSKQDLLDLIESVLANPKFDHDKHLLPFVASIFSSEGDYDAAIDIYKLLPRTNNFLLDAARYMATASRFDEALALVAEVQSNASGSFANVYDGKKAEFLRLAILKEQDLQSNNKRETE